MFGFVLPKPGDKKKIKEKIKHAGMVLHTAKNALYALYHHKPPNSLIMASIHFPFKNYTNVWGLTDKQKTQVLLLFKPQIRSSMSLI